MTCTRCGKSGQHILSGWVNPCAANACHWPTRTSVVQGTIGTFLNEDLIRESEILRCNSSPAHMQIRLIARSVWRVRLLLRENS